MAVVKQEASGGGNGQVCSSSNHNNSNSNKIQQSQLSSLIGASPKVSTLATLARKEGAEQSCTGNAAEMQQPVSGGGEVGENACAGCQMPIKDRFIFCVIEQNFHQDCVRCADCLANLNERCYTFEGKLYCRMDYWRRFGPKCSACQGPIKATELVQRLKENLVYHLRCFACQDCKRHLKAGEQLHLIDERRLLCKRDYLLAGPASRPLECNIHSTEGNGEPHLPAAPRHAHLGHRPHQPNPQQHLHMMQQQQQQQQQHQQRRNQQNQENESSICERPDSVSSSESAECGLRRKHPRVAGGTILAGDDELASGDPSSLLLGDADELDADELDGGRSSVEGAGDSGDSGDPQRHSSSSGPESEQQLQQLQHAHQHRSGSRVGGGAGGPGHKPTRVRTVLNEKQLQTLRDCYAHNPRPDALMKEQLVDLTGLSPRVIRVWFQNKRCKDKKKSILYKQMQQHEKEGRQFAGLTLLRGLPMVASSPVQYDDQSTLSSTPGAAAAAPHQSTGAPAPPTPVRPAEGPSPATAAAASAQHHPQQQQQQPQSLGAGHAHLEVHAYQPPWKSLAEYARQQAHDRQPLEAAASPRYQQLMNQVHGYTITPQTSSDELSQDPQQQQQQQHLQHHL